MFPDPDGWLLRRLSVCSQYSRRSRASEILPAVVKSASQAALIGPKMWGELSQQVNLNHHRQWKLTVTFRPYPLWTPGISIVFHESIMFACTEEAALFSQRNFYLPEHFGSQLRSLKIAPDVCFCADLQRWRSPG
jgi:hypothetical protein